MSHRPARSALPVTDGASGSAGTSWCRRSARHACAAVARAAFRDLDAARRCANGLNVPSDRAQAPAAVAGYPTGTPSSLRSVSHSTSSAFTRTFLALAQSQLPAGTARPAQEAWSIAVDALAVEGWNHVLPALACIAPASVLRVRDIVFAHRRLDPYFAGHPFVNAETMSDDRVRLRLTETRSPCGTRVRGSV